ncbi:MAG: c-type cytochrome [Granulosicoccaceae bacterium]
MRIKLLLVGILLAAVQSTSMAEGDVVEGQKLAHTCLGCHGVKHYVNTYPTYHVPRIAGQHEIYIVAALKAYRSKQRPHKTMQANASDLTDQNMEDVAAYFASLGADAKGSSKIEDEPLAATCMTCHGPGGLSTITANPILAGQYKSYIKQALESYRAADRKNPIMGGFASALSDEDIGKLAEYFSAHNGPLRTAD